MAVGYSLSLCKSTKAKKWLSIHQGPVSRTLVDGTSGVEHSVYHRPRYWDSLGDIKLQAQKDRVYR